MSIKGQVYIYHRTVLLHYPTKTHNYPKDKGQLGRDYAKTGSHTGANRLILFNLAPVVRFGQFHPAYLSMGSKEISPRASLVRNTRILGVGLRTQARSLQKGGPYTWNSIDSRKRACSALGAASRHANSAPSPAHSSTEPGESVTSPGRITPGHSAIIAEGNLDVHGVPEVMMRETGSIEHAGCTTMCDPEVEVSLRLSSGGVKAPPVREQGGASAKLGLTRPIHTAATLPGAQPA